MSGNPWACMMYCNLLLEQIAIHHASPGDQRSQTGWCGVYGPPGAGSWPSACWQWAVPCAIQTECYCNNSIHPILFVRGGSGNTMKGKIPNLSFKYFHVFGNALSVSLAPACLLCGSFKLPLVVGWRVMKLSHDGSLLLHHHQLGPQGFASRWP